MTWWLASSSTFNFIADRLYYLKSVAAVNGRRKSFGAVNDRLRRLEFFGAVNERRKCDEISQRRLRLRLGLWLRLVELDSHCVIHVVDLRMYRDWLLLRRLSGIIGVGIQRQSVLGIIERNSIRGQRLERRWIVGNGNLIETLPAVIALDLIADRLHRLVRHILEDFRQNVRRSLVRRWFILAI